jgi:hypothetical protein
MAEKLKFTRQDILMQPEFAHIKEAMQYGAQAHLNAGEAFDFWKPIREIPLQAWYDKSKNAMSENRLNPNLPDIMFHRYGIPIGHMARTHGGNFRETVSIPNELSALKIADEVIEGAEPWSDWKQYSRLIDMQTPKVNVPLTKYTDTVTGDITVNGTIFEFAEAGGTPAPIGGKVETIELDTSGKNNSFRGNIGVDRNDVKDNNFLAVEQSLKNAGNQFYWLVGKRIISQLVTTATNTATKAALAPTGDPAEFASLIEVVRSRFPGSQRNRADTMFINPADAARAVNAFSTVGGGWPFLSRFITGPTDDRDVINNSGLAASLGLRNVWETPQITTGNVLITKRDIAQVVGVREDLTIENFDLRPGGLYESDLVIRFDVQKAEDNGSFLVTAYNV